MAEERIVPMRLQRFLARAGGASRRGSERLMTSGRVTVNGQVVTELGSKVDPLVDVVAVDGIVCSIAEKPVYLMLNKPAGYLTTMKDPQGRPTIVDMFQLSNTQDFSLLDVLIWIPRVFCSLLPMVRWHKSFCIPQSMYGSTMLLM